MRICIYCGSRPGDTPLFTETTRRLGRLMAMRGHSLVYGGGKVGLMGTVADAVLASGGHAVGVIPQALMEREVGHRGLQELHVVQTMHERKLMMAERADAFLALPGGIGTLEELFEMWSWQQLGYHDKPVALLNVDGYYNALLKFIRSAHGRGFISTAQVGALVVDGDVERLLDRIQAAVADGISMPDDYSRI